MADYTGQVFGKYRIQKRVGAGGNGIVFKAAHVDTGEVVAVKVISPELADDDEFRTRLRTEADIIRDLRHPHIVELRDYWEDDRGIWVVMSWLGGGDLRRRVENDDPLTPLELSPILEQICSALDAAHAAQVIHRDVKPDNIMLDDSGKAYLTDFGVAKRLNYDGITRQGEVVGSPRYLSPEQIMAEDLSGRSDVFALGITVYELLTGSHPFEDAADTNLQMMLAMSKNDVPSLTKYAPDIPRADALDALIRRATSKKIASRYPTASAFAQHFKAIAIATRSND